MSEWRSAEHASAYLRRADHVPTGLPVKRRCSTKSRPTSAGFSIWAPGMDGCWSRAPREPHATGVALDFSPLMIDRSHQVRADVARAEIVHHNLAFPLPRLGLFDAVVSSFAIHHLAHERKRQLYQEIWDLLEQGGVFCNLEHVASVSPYAHQRFLQAMGITPAEEDPLEPAADVDTQLEWLRDIGFEDVDCYWKWRELALLVGRKEPPAAA